MKIGQQFYLRWRFIGLILFLGSAIAAGWLMTQHMNETYSSAAARIVTDKTSSTATNVALRSTAERSSEPETFETRCHEAGVQVCVGFDSPAGFLPARWPASGLYPAWDKVLRGTMDTAVKASGRGSLRFEIPSHSAANAAGFWLQRMGRSFGEGSTFYVQFRQRFSQEMLKNKWGNTSWKQVIFHNSESTCADVELTTGQFYQEGFPIMYTDCGGRGMYTNEGTPPYKLEQGDYNCWYSHYNPKDCFFYPANQWVTFYYEISIGHWGKPDSTIKAWVALDGRPFRQWIELPNFVLKNDSPGHDYDSLTLLTYMTNKDTTVDHPTAYTWYDELIISTRPIAPPASASSSPSN